MNARYNDEKIMGQNAQRQFPGPVATAENPLGQSEITIEMRRLNDEIVAVESATAELMKRLQPMIARGPVAGQANGTQAVESSPASELGSRIYAARQNLASLATDMNALLRDLAI